MSGTPTTIGRYEVRAELGRGSMGIVHRAHDPLVGRDVAIKTILLPHGLPSQREEEYRERFQREARAAGRLSHPGIVTVYEFTNLAEDGLPFIAMEYVEGGSVL
jgi:serine/threonine-protein kinase